MTSSRPAENILLGNRKARRPGPRSIPRVQPQQLGTTGINVTRQLPILPGSNVVTTPTQCPPGGIFILSQPDTAVTVTKTERDQILSETAAREQELPLLTIVKSNISLYSWEEMQLIAGPIRVTNLNFEGTESVNDPRMGVVSLNVPCHYCSKIDCPGHYGLIDFGIAIYNPCFMREVVSVITCVCNDCGGLLITEDVMRQRGFFKLNYNDRLVEMENYCKQDMVCLRQKPQIAGGVLVPCAKNPTFITSDIKEKGEITYRVAQQGNKKASSEDPTRILSIKSVIEILNRISSRDSFLLGFPCYHYQYTPDVVLKILDKVPQNDLVSAGIQQTNDGVVTNHRSISYKELLSILDSLPGRTLGNLGFPLGSHPKNMIMYGILVPPVIARPPVYESGAIHYDQLTHMYMTIMRRVIEIANGKTSAISELYTCVKQLIFKTEGKKMGMRDFLSIIERIQGKSALLRGLLMGKRTNYCGRTVAGPDASLRFGQIRIPEIWAAALTKKIKVTSFNIQELRKLMEDGKITHYTPKKTGLRRFYDSRSKYNLQIGDVVDRWLQNGDRIVINRQPTLHRQSMMSYEVVLGPQLTIGFHISYCAPKNLDFDGDEGNAWNPQDFEVEAELDRLLNVKNNIMSAEKNDPIMGLVMNSVSGAYLLSKSNVYLDDDLFNELLGMITDQESINTLYPRLIKYGIHPRSGKAIFSALLPKDFYYKNKGVTILEGVLISGILKKAHVGISSRSIIQELWKKYGPQRTADFFTDAPWVINKWIIEYGFSVGMLDCINFAIDPQTGEEYDRSKRVLDRELAKIYIQLEALGSKLNDPIEESFRQRQITNLVNVAQGIGLKLAKEVLSGNTTEQLVGIKPGTENSIGVMTDQGAGTKGGIANIGQMFGAVGQQFYRGERLKPTLSGGRRLLPTYDFDDPNPVAHGFIPDSFFTGVSPDGYYYALQGGRENLLDTALKTSETGAMQHRLIKALENFYVWYDGSIRNTIGTHFAPMYYLGYDVAEMIAVKDKSKAKLSSFIDIKSMAAELNVKRGWIPAKTSEFVLNQRRILNTDNIQPENILKVTPDNYFNGPIVRDTTIKYDINQPVTPVQRIIKITKFEEARIIGTRATQLSNNVPPLVDIGNEIDPVKIAKMEYKAGVLQLYIIRKFPDGTYQTIYPTLDNI